MMKWWWCWIWLWQTEDRADGAAGGVAVVVLDMVVADKDRADGAAVAAGGVVVVGDGAGWDQISALGAPWPATPQHSNGPCRGEQNSQGEDSEELDQSHGGGRKRLLLSDLVS